MPVRLSVLLLTCLALCGLSVQAQRGGAIFPGNPRHDAGMQHPGFADTLRILAVAGQITHQLQPGTAQVRSTPQGPRLMLPLLYQGKEVATVLLRPDGTLATRNELPALPDALAVPPLARARLTAQVTALSVSGAVGVRPRDYTVTLLLAGQPVGQLHLLADTLLPRLETGKPDAKDGQPGHPNPDQR